METILLLNPGIDADSDVSDNSNSIIDEIRSVIDNNLVSDSGAKRFNYGEREEVYRLCGLAAQFYESKDGASVADSLGQEYRDFLVDGLLYIVKGDSFEKTLFSRFDFYEHLAEADGKDVDVYKMIKTSCRTSDIDMFENVVFSYEILHFLGLNNPQDTRNNARIVNNMYNSMIQSMIESRGMLPEEMVYFLASSVPVKFGSKRKKEMFEVYVKKQKDVIDAFGFSCDIVSQLQDFETKIGGFFDEEKDDIYRSAKSSLSKRMDSDSFMKDFYSIYEYFGKMPKKPKGVLKSYILELLSEKSLSSEEIFNLLVAQESYMRLNRDNKDKSEFSSFLSEVFSNPEFNNVLDLIYRDKSLFSNGGVKYLVSDGSVSLEQKMIEQAGYLLGDTGDSCHDTFEDYSKIFRLIYGNSNMAKHLRKQVVDSVTRTKDEEDGIIFDKKTRIPAYINSWNSIASKTKALKDVFGIDLAGDIKSSRDLSNITEMSRFQNKVAGRIKSEVKQGNKEGISFWEDIMSGKNTNKFYTR